jgi:hypothetical protein
VARSAKSRTSKTETPPTDPVEEVISALPEVEPDMGGDQSLSDPQPAADLAETTPLIASDVAVEPDILPEPEPVQHRPVVTDPPAMAPPAPPPQTTIQKVGLGPLILGGILAAILGYAAAYFGQQGQSAQIAALLAAQTDRITALEAEVAALPAPTDLAPVTTALGDLQSMVNAGQAETVAALATLDGRVATLEKAPNADGTLSATAIATWEAELQSLRAEVATQEARMQDIADAATAQLDQTRVAAATIEQTATESAAVVITRAALARVQAALDSGAPFDAALSDLAGTVTVPAALTEVAADGVPTIMALQADFPAAARAALGVARSEGLAGEEGGGVAAFLRNQFDVRSVTPQDGTSADAILSRAEDDLRQNRLTDALAEVASLPEVVRAELAGWTGAAEARIAAIAAVEGLSQSLTSN